MGNSEVFSSSDALPCVWKMLYGVAFLSVCSELQYVLEDARAKVLLTSPSFAEQMQPLAKAADAHLHIVGQACIDESFPQVRCCSLSCLKPASYSVHAFF